MRPRTWPDEGAAAATLSRRIFGVAVEVAALTWCLLCGSAMAVAQERGEGPMSLFLSYKCPAEYRAEFRAYLEARGLEQFEGWKQDKAIADYLILFSSYAYQDPGLPDAMVRLDFGAYAQLAAWKEIERSMPAGLSSRALTMCKPLAAHAADLSWEGGDQPINSRDFVYIVVPVHFKGSKSEYAKYFEAYVKPQYDGWVDDGALSWWGAYHNHLRQGDVWDLLVLYRYRDLAGLAQRDVVKERVRAKLKQDADWLYLHESKLDIRRSSQAIPMDPILLSR